MEWESVIGLEIHAQLATQSKLFSGASVAYGAAANTQACAVDLGLPGVLPVLNEAVLTMAIKLGLALDATIAPVSVFARKNYFYPDSPKGYQISQHELPIIEHGKLEIHLEDGTHKTISVTRAHLEEDAGKSVHEGFESFTGIDLNRAGTPLLEIVSEPELRSAKEAVAYMKKMHSLVRYLGISDGNMQEGSFRCDANVSVRPKGQEAFGTRAEIKNINSFRFVERAINYEIERQIELIEDGGKVVQETRLYDPDKNETRSMRGKEDAHDYRYFPDPDLLPVRVTAEDIESVRKQLPELPEAKAKRFRSQYQLSEYDADYITASRELADFYEHLVDAAPQDPKLAANWLMGSWMANLNRDDLDLADAPVEASALAGLLMRISDKTISGKIAKTVFDVMWQSGADADTVIEKQGLKQITDSGAIEAIVDKVLADNPGQVAEYRGGKEKVFGFFVGQVMKASKGKANPQQVNDLLKSKLNG